MDMRPPEPKLEFRLRERVFTHKSFKPTVSLTEEPADWERLAFVGEGILFATISDLLCRLFPFRRAVAMKQFRVKLMSKEILSTVTDAYRWMKHVKCTEGDRPNIVQSADNRAAVLESFIGGVFHEHGLKKASEWAESVVVTCLRGWLIEEGADLGEVMKLALNATSGQSHPNQPPAPSAPPLPVASPSTFISQAKPQAPIGTGRPTHSVPVKRENDMDVDGEPMDTSESEATFPLPSASPSTSTPYQFFAGATSLPVLNDPVEVKMDAYSEPPAYTPKAFNPERTRRPFVESVASPLSVSDSDNLSFQSFGVDSYLEYETPANSTRDRYFSTSSAPRRAPNPNFYSTLSSSRPLTPPLASTSSYLGGRQSQPYSYGEQHFGRYNPSASSSRRDASPAQAPSPPQSDQSSRLGSRVATQADKARILSGALARLNERAKTRNLIPDWTFSSEGQGQFIVWTAKVSLPGRGLVGDGQGQSKQLAKEIAAKVALETLRWNS